MATRRRSQAASAGASSGRRAELIAAAVQIFAAKGYEAASTQEISERLGLLKGSIYYYIKSKEELLFEVVKSVHEDMAKNLERAREREGSVADRLRGYFVDLVQLTLSRLEYSTVFYRDFRHLSKRHQTVIIQQRGDYEQVLVQLLKEGQRTGAVRRDLDPKLMATATITMITALHTWFRTNGAFTLDEVVESYTRLALTSVGVPAEEADESIVGAASA